VADIELAGFLAHLRQEHPLEEEVAQLLAKLRRRSAFDGLENLVGFLEHEGTQRSWRLLAVPRTAVRSPQDAHDFYETFELLAGGLSHGRHATIHPQSGRKVEKLKGQRREVSSMLACLVVIQCVSPLVATAQSTSASSHPRTPWGDPDLQGYYTNKYEYGTPF